MFEFTPEELNSVSIISNESVPEDTKRTEIHDTQGPKGDKTYIYRSIASYTYIALILAITLFLFFSSFRNLIEVPFAWPVFIGIYLIPIHRIRDLSKMPEYEGQDNDTVVRPKRSYLRGIILLVLGLLGLIIPSQILSNPQGAGFAGLIALALGIPAFVLALYGLISIIMSSAANISRSHKQMQLGGINPRTTQKLLLSLETLFVLFIIFELIMNLVN